MSTLVLAMAVCGGVAAFGLTWIFVSLVGLVALPAIGAGLVFGLGVSPADAILWSGLGYVALQVSYVLAGLAGEVIAARSRRANGGHET